jgi:hypothetical protein
MRFPFSALAAVIPLNWLAVASILLLDITNEEKKIARVQAR